MRRKPLLIGAGIIAAVAVGLGMIAWQSTADIPDDPDEVILFSVDGTTSHKVPEERGIPKGQELLYGDPVLGRVTITDPALRREVVAAVKRDIRTGHPAQSKCMWTRHVLRIVKGGRTIDVAICYQCHNYELHREGGPHEGRTPAIGEESKPLLNSILTEAGVAIAP
jgi:hypothetical protein